MFSLHHNERMLLSPSLLMVLAVFSMCPLHWCCRTCLPVRWAPLMPWRWDQPACVVSARLKAGCVEHSTLARWLSSRMHCQVSLAHWNQDDEYGGFGGAHAMVHGGYSGLLEPLAARLDVRLGAPVARIMDTNAGVRVTTASGAHLHPRLPASRPRQAHENHIRLASAGLRGELQLPG